jgi:hypothetical protein
VGNGAMKALLGGFNCILFWNFNEIQTQNDSYWQNSKFLIFACLKMVLFLELMHLKFAKTATWPNFFSHQISMAWGIKKRIMCRFQIR